MCYDNTLRESKLQVSVTGKSVKFFYFFTAFDNADLRDVPGNGSGSYSVEKTDGFNAAYLRQHRTIRHRRLLDNLRPDFVTFSCNTQSIPAKKCHHQNSNSLRIRSRQIVRCCPKETLSEYHFGAFRRHKLRIVSLPPGLAKARSLRCAFSSHPSESALMGTLSFSAARSSQKLEIHKIFLRFFAFLVTKNLSQIALAVLNQRFPKNRPPGNRTRPDPFTKGVWNL